MPFPAAINDLFQLRVKGTEESQETNNVMHFSCVGASADVELHLIVVLVTCFINHIIPVVSSQWQLRSVIWKRVGPTLGPEFEYVPPAAEIGAGNAAALPSFSSVVFSIHTAQGGRSKRGRFFIPGIPEAVTVNSRLDTTNAFWTAMLAFAACLATEFIHADPAGGTDLFDLGVYSRKLGGATFPYTAAGFTAATSIVPHDLIATTRSRKVGRGS